MIALALWLAAVPARAAAPGNVADMSGFLSSWRQDCADGCALPAPEKADLPAAARVDVPMNPGEARVASFAQDLVFAGGEKVRAAVTVYYLCPPDARPRPGDDSCPSRYVQVQVVLSGDAKAFCAASLNPADAFPFPVLMCAGENLRRPRERLGVSLSRRAVQPAAGLLDADLRPRG